MKYTDEEGGVYETVIQDGQETIIIRPVKKTEKTKLFELRLLEENTVVDDDKLLFGGELTPTTANKLSEAISALVEYVTNPVKVNQDPPSYEADFQILENYALGARISYQESQ